MNGKEIKQVGGKHPEHPRLAGRDRRKRIRHARGIEYVKLAAQRDNDVTIAFAGT
jgi:hypothetical protein